MKKIEMTRNFAYGVSIKNDSAVTCYDSIKNAFDFVYRQYGNGDIKDYWVWMVSNQTSYPIVECQCVDGKMYEIMLDPSDLSKENASENLREVDLREVFHKNTLKALDKIVSDIIKFGEETEDKEDVELYEEPTVSFCIKNVRLDKDGYLRYDYKGGKYYEWQLEEDKVAYIDEETGEACAVEGLDSLSEIVKFWRACLNRAKKYWNMSPEELDKLQDNE